MSDGTLKDRRRDSVVPNQKGKARQGKRRERKGKIKKREGRETKREEKHEVKLGEK